MEQQQFGEPREEGLFEESINLRHYWHIVLERRWLVVATFAVVMVLCLFYLFTVTSIFSATTRLQIDNETENSMRMESFVMEGNQGQDYLQTQYKNLQSRSFDEDRFVGDTTECDDSGRYQIRNAYSESTRPLL